MNRVVTECLVVFAVLAAFSLAVIPSVAVAAEKRCGSIGSGAPDYRDVRAVSTSCASARSLARAYADALGRCGNVLNRCRVKGFTCRGHGSDRRIEGKDTFRVNCRRDEAKVRWWITVFH
jgi:hypothetical protein